MSSFFYFLKESLTGFTRNLSTALGSIVTIFLSLLIIGIFLVGGFGGQQRGEVRRAGSQHHGLDRR